jgi:hypothetical protein
MDVTEKDVQKEEKSCDTCRHYDDSPSDYPCVLCVYLKTAFADEWRARDQGK